MGVLVNREFDNRLESQGYVSFELFDKEQIASIQRFYQSIAKEHNTGATGFHTTLNTSNAMLIKRVDNFLGPIIKQALKKHLSGLNFTVSGFLVKDPGEETSVKIHQDWNYVDESLYSSYSFWIPLGDTNLRNGCMQFIPGSHSFFKSLRISPDIPEYFHDFKANIVKYLVDIPVKAGTCVMFNQAIIHASRKNNSIKPRVVCIVAGYPKEAKLLHHFLPQGKGMDEIEQYEITVRSIKNLKKDQAPPYAKLIKLIHYNHPKVSLHEFEKKCKEMVSRGSVLKNVILNFFYGKSC